MFRLIGVTILFILILVTGASGQGSWQLLERPGVEAWLDKECFSEGEELVVHVRSDQTGFLTIIDITPDGLASVLCPNRLTPKVRLLGGVTYDFPSPDHGFRIRVKVPANVRPTDKELLWVIVTEAPLEVDFYMARRAEAMVREIEDELYALPYGTWWAATVVSFSYAPCESAHRPSLQEVEDEIETLNHAIQQFGAEWVAGFTPLAFVTEEELSMYCGALLDDRGLDPAFELNISSLQPLRSHRLPSLLDWRKLNGDWTTPVKDQGRCGACWIFGPVAVFESLLDIDSQDPADRPQDILSEQYVLSYIREGMQEGKRGCSGGWPQFTMKFLTEHGTVTNTCFPYLPDDRLRENYSVGCLTQRLYRWKFLKGKNWEPLPVETIKKLVYTYGPVTAYMVVYSDFLLYKKGVYTHVRGNKGAGHMVLIAGWEDGTRSWICKNSWGPLWGMDGWFQIRWNECKIGCLVLAGQTQRTANWIEDYGSLYEYIRRVTAED